MMSVEKEMDTDFTEVMTSEKIIHADGQLCIGYRYKYLNYTEVCECPLDPQVTYIVVNMRLPGNPVQFKPKDVDYNIRIWKLETVQSLANLMTLEDKDLVANFTLANTDDPVDLEIMY